jgi:MFS family permease
LIVENVAGGALLVDDKQLTQATAQATGLKGRFILPLRAALLRPIAALRWHYAPLLIVYFSYGALGLIDVSRDLWVKESLSLSPADLAGIGVWLTLPWTIKMVFGQLVDSVPLFGSQRRIYIIAGALLSAAGLVTLAGAAGGWLAFLPASGLFVLGSILVVLGTVVQDVVADAMSTEVVRRLDDKGAPRDEGEVRAELGMVQVLGRLALSAGIVAVAGLSGWVAAMVGREQVFLLALIVPALSLVGALMASESNIERRPIDWPIFAGGIVFGLTVVAIGLLRIPLGQEIIFIISMTVVCVMLVQVTRDVARETRRAIFFTAIIIFAFRATPAVGDGYFWFTIDVLKFDESFYGVLRQTAAIISVTVLWLFSKQLTEYSVRSVLFWLTILGALLSLPNIGLYYGLHDWTEATLGFGARSIAIIDAATNSPFVQLSMVPLLALIAFYAPPGKRATWFALMASLMNLALVVGQLSTKYLNHIFVVGRGQYGELGLLLICVVTLGLIVPLTAIALFGRRIVH